MVSPEYQKLTTLLKELFQLDQPDLNFGLYRVMHAKSFEVSNFLDNDLLPQVREAFSKYKSADSGNLQARLSKMIADIEAAGMNPDDSPTVNELRAQIANEAVDLGALERDVRPPVQILQALLQGG